MALVSVLLIIYHSPDGEHETGGSTIFYANFVNRTIVVDSYLNVHGVSGLKIADLSVPPLQVAANLYSTALAFGEKAADIILEELSSC
jgi:choline dehydrogenase-like flavoprotein